MLSSKFIIVLVAWYSQNLLRFCYIFHKLRYALWLFPTYSFQVILILRDIILYLFQSRYECQFSMFNNEKRFISPSWIIAPLLTDSYAGSCLLREFICTIMSPLAFMVDTVNFFLISVLHIYSIFSGCFQYLFYFDVLYFYSEVSNIFSARDF